MSIKSFPGSPLFDSAKYFNQIPRNEIFPDQSPAVEAFVINVPVEGALEDYRYTRDFLASYSKKSQDTYDKFKGDAERLLLWAWLVQGKSVAELRRRDLEEYTDFVASPDPAWQTQHTIRRFKSVNGVREPNNNWRPFRSEGVGKGRLNTKSWQGLFSNLSVFFNYLMAEDYVPGNHISIVKKIVLT